MNQQNENLDNQKAPPSDLHAEEALLGCLLPGPGDETEGAEAALDFVTAADFYHEATEQIFAAICTVWQQEQCLDRLLVASELSSREQLEKNGGLIYLEQLAKKPITAAHWQRYAKIVKDKANLRDLIKQAADLEKQAKEPDANPVALRSRAVTALEQVKIASAEVSDIDAQDLPTILGGTTWLHKPLLARGYLTMLVGTSFVGKSVTGYRLALSAIGELPWPGTDLTVDEPGVVCWAECESGQQSIVDRIADWKLTRPGIRIAGAEGERRFSIPADLDEIRAWLTQSKATLFIADSFRTFFGGNENSSGEVTGALLPLAEMLRDLNIPGLLLHHSRKVQELESHVFELEKTRGSSAVYAVPRIIAAMDLPDRETETRRLFVVQSNIGPAGDSWGVDIDPETGLPTFTDEVPQEPREKMTTRTCKDFLTDLLAFGPAKVPDILTQGEEQGFKRRTVFTAAKAVGIYRRRVSGPKGVEYSLWSLTPFPEQPLFTEDGES